MESSKALVITLIVTLSILSISVHSNDILSTESEVPYSNINLKGTGRFLADDDSRRNTVVACDKYRNVCRAKGGSSSGQTCCNKQCVDVSTDKLNCGKCGKKCNYSQMCCQGKCVNTSVNAKHCGRCNNACEKGSSCAYGLCSYAN